jgi:hypothetical protein
MEINDAAPKLPDNTAVRTEETKFVMKQAIRTLMLLLALTGVSVLAGCHITFGAVNLDRIENPREWGGHSGSGGPGRPIDR